MYLLWFYHHEKKPKKEKTFLLQKCVLLTYLSSSTIQSNFFGVKEWNKDYVFTQDPEAQGCTLFSLMWCSIRPYQMSKGRRPTVLGSKTSQFLFYRPIISMSGMKESLHCIKTYCFKTNYVFKWKIESNYIILKSCNKVNSWTYQVKTFVIFLIKHIAVSHSNIFLNNPKMLAK